MQVIMIGGFSEHCKRGIVENIITKLSLVSPSSKLTIVLNGEDDFTSGDESAGSLDISIASFAEGCFCCGLGNELQALLSRDIRERGPETILMTLSVVTDLDQVTQLVKSIAGTDLELLKIYGLDLSNATAILNAFPDLVDRNLAVAESVVLVEDKGGDSSLEDHCISLIRAIDPSLSIVSREKIMGKRSIMITRADIVGGSSSIWNFIREQ